MKADILFKDKFPNGITPILIQKRNPKRYKNPKRRVGWRKSLVKTEYKKKYYQNDDGTTSFIFVPELKVKLKSYVDFFSTKKHSPINKSF
jgi:hypothetical protein